MSNECKVWDKMAFELIDWISEWATKNKVHQRDAYEIALSARDKKFSDKQVEFHTLAVKNLSSRVQSMDSNRCFVTHKELLLLKALGDACYNVQIWDERRNKHMYELNEMKCKYIEMGVLDARWYELEEKVTQWYKNDQNVHWKLEDRIKCEKCNWIGNRKDVEWREPADFESDIPPWAICPQCSSTIKDKIEVKYIQPKVDSKTIADEKSGASFVLRAYCYSDCPNRVSGDRCKELDSRVVVYETMPCPLFKVETNEENDNRP